MSGSRCSNPDCHSRGLRRWQGMNVGFGTSSGLNPTFIASRSRLQGAATANTVTGVTNTVTGAANTPKASLLPPVCWPFRSACWLFRSQVSRCRGALSARWGLHRFLLAGRQWRIVAVQRPQSSIDQPPTPHSRAHPPRASVLLRPSAPSLTNCESPVPMVSEESPLQVPRCALP